MKKIQLSIPAPCQADWNAMTSESKGKFCGSCQKTVVDFSAMSDRQLADFFKKPTGSVCGRFHNDQLDREIAIPRKRIPWVKYFFQFTWPAFVLLLKSCGQRDYVVGELEVEKPMENTETKMQIATLGQVMPKITPVDSTQRLMGDTIAAQTQGELTTTGIIMKMSSDSIAKPVQVKKPVVIGSLKRCKIEAIGNDNAGFGKAPATFQPVSLQVKDFSPISEMQFLIMGGIGVTRISNTEKKLPAKTMAKEIKQATPSRFLVYPNPASANSVVNITVASIPEGRYSVSLINSAGSVVQQFVSTISVGATGFQFELKQIAAGSYFLPITNDKTGVSFTESLIVL